MFFLLTKLVIWDSDRDHQYTKPIFSPLNCWNRSEIAPKRFSWIRRWTLKKIPSKKNDFFRSKNIFKQKVEEKNRTFFDFQFFRSKKAGVRALQTIFSVFSASDIFFRPQIWKVQKFLHKSYSFYFKTLSVRGETANQFLCRKMVAFCGRAWPAFS